MVVDGNGEYCGSIEQWCQTPFLIAGGFLLGSTALKGLEAFTGLQPPGVLVALFLLPGLMASIVGLLGLYPRLADQRSRLPRIGVVVAAVTGITIVGTFVWGIGAALLTAVLGIGISVTPPGVVYVFVMILMALTFALFGVATLRTDVHHHTVALLLLTFASTWIIHLITSMAYGAAAPLWLYFLVYGMQPPILLASEYSLRFEANPTQTGFTRTESLRYYFDR